MNNYDTTKNALKRAKRWFQGALRALEDERWDDVIYSYEMSVEQALKAILILYGIEYPKRHDITNILIQLKKEDIPDYFSNNLDKYANLLSILIDKRGPAAYGYIEGISKDSFKKDATNLKKEVGQTLEECDGVLKDFNKKNK